MTLEELERIARDRRTASPDESYTATLLGDPELAQRKIMEEAFELCLEIGRTTSDPERVAAEAADLLYHLVVGLVSVDVPIDDVFGVLEGRRA
jgi:phosphoribosyl-ATP pyrophosphohydrolase